MAKTTWFAIDRDIQNHWVWEDKPFAYGQAWIDLILMAQFADKATLYRGNLQNRKRGEVWVSLTFLADRWGWSKSKTRHFLKLLESDRMVTRKAHAGGTTLTIENWGLYQGQRHTEGIAEGTAEGTAERTRNYNEYKDNNVIYNAHAREEEDSLTEEEKQANVDKIKEMLKGRFVN